MNKQNTQQKQNPRASGKDASGAASKSRAGERKQADAGSTVRSAKGEPPKGGVEGEGSYTGARRYNENLAKHLETHDVEQEAEAARTALEGDEREELEEAEHRGKQGPSGQRQSPKR